jgi:arsenate reductase
VVSEKRPPAEELFNTSGQKYRELNLKDRLTTMSEEEQLKLLASDGMLVKRPLLIRDDLVLVGFRESEWESKL